jgi:hypothetical protein
MAYHVYVFARSGDPVVQRLLPELLHEVVRVPGARATNLHDGVATAGCDLISTGYDGQIVLTRSGEAPSVWKTMSGLARL